MTIRWARLMETRPQTLSPREYQVLLGSLLGDGFLRVKRPYVTPYYAESHKADHLVYLQWKAEELKRFGPRIRVREQPTRSYQLRTLGCPAFGELGAAFYPEGKKSLPENHVQRLEALGLAIWYMDDGAYSETVGWAFLHSQSFTEAENLLLRDMLRDKFGVQTKVNRRPRVKNRSVVVGEYTYLLYVPVREVRKLFEIIRPYLQPVMLYKLGEGGD